MYTPGWDFNDVSFRGSMGSVFVNINYKELQSKIISAYYCIFVSTELQENRKTTAVSNKKQHFLMKLIYDK